MNEEEIIKIRKCDLQSILLMVTFGDHKLVDDIFISVDVLKIKD